MGMCLDNYWSCSSSISNLLNFDSIWGFASLLTKAHLRPHHPLVWRSFGDGCLTSEMYLPHFLGVFLLDFLMYLWSVVGGSHLFPLPMAGRNWRCFAWGTCPPSTRVSVLFRANILDNMRSPEGERDTRCALVYETTRMNHQRNFLMLNASRYSYKLNQV